MKRGRTAAPVHALDREALERTGARNLGDVVQYLTSSPASDFEGRGQGKWGTTEVNLRGLGPQATLVLINGRRVVPSGSLSASGAGSGTVVDLGQIPISAIDRIEILDAGGAAIYGSDAVAGVVNVITRKDYDGVRIDLNGQASTTFDHGAYTASGTVGVSAPRARANLSVAYERQTRLAAADRDFTEGGYIANSGNPATFIVERPGAPTPPGVYPDPACGPGTASLSLMNGFCAVDNRRASDLIAARDRISGLGYGEYDLSAHTHVFAELGISSMRNETSAPSSFPVLQEVYVPTDHVDNPFGARLRYFGAPLPQSAPLASIRGEDDTLRVAVGIAGDLAGLEWELYGTWGRSRYRGVVPDTLVEPLQQALDRCADPGDLSRCYNPFYSSVTGAGTSNSRAVLDSFSGEATWVSDSTLITSGAGITGGLLDLPGGRLGFALGAQYRRHEAVGDADHDSNQLRYGYVLGNTDLQAHRDVAAAYLELLLPLYAGLELQTAGRLEHHEGVGTALSPSMGAVITPAEIVGVERAPASLRRLRLHAQATWAFRAPSIYETAPGFVTSIQRFDGEGPIPVFRPVRLFGNSELDPERALVISTGVDWSPIRPLKMSVEYWNYRYDDLVTAETAQEIYRADRLDPRIQRDASGQLQGVVTNRYNAAFADTHGLDFGAVATVGSAPEISLAVQGSYLFAYEIPRSAVPDITLVGPTAAPGDDTRIARPGCDAERCDLAGNRNATTFVRPLPRLRLNASLSARFRAHFASLTVHYIDSYRDDFNTNPTTGSMAKIDSFTTLDLMYAFNFAQALGAGPVLRVGVLNLLGAEPPPVESAGNFDIYVHDARGTMLYASVTQEL